MINDIINGNQNGSYFSIICVVLVGSNWIQLAILCLKRELIDWAVDEQPASMTKMVAKD